MNTTSTKLIHPMCKKQKRHMVVYLGLGLCCIHHYDEDKKNHLSAWRRGQR